MSQRADLGETQSDQRIVTSIARKAAEPLSACSRGGQQASLSANSATPKAGLPEPRRLTEPPQHQGRDCRRN
jgi:hypothetical protein